QREGKLLSRPRQCCDLRNRGGRERKFRLYPRLPAQRLTCHDNVFSTKNRSYVRRLGRSSGFRIQLLTAPSRGRLCRAGPVSHPSSCEQWLSQRSSPVTAAGPRRIHTVFPILLPGNKSSETPRSLSAGSRSAPCERPHPNTPDRDCNR